MASTCPCASGWRHGCTAALGGVAALVRGVRGPPGRPWRGARTVRCRRGRGPARRLRPGPRGAARGARQPGPASWHRSAGAITAAHRGARPRALRWRAPVACRPVQRPGTNGSGGCERPCRRHDRRRGWDTRLAPAEPRRAALTPARGRGTRPRRADATRVEAIDHGLTAQRVDG